MACAHCIRRGLDPCSEVTRGLLEMGWTVDRQTGDRQFDRRDRQTSQREARLRGVDSCYAGNWLARERAGKDEGIVERMKKFSAF